MFDALIDDQIGDFGETINVRFARAKISALDRVMEQSVDAIAIVLIILCGIDPALRCNRVRAPWRILKAKAFYPVAEFAQGRRRRSAGETASHNDDLELSPIIWANQSRVIPMAAPFLIERSVWNPGVQRPDHNCCAGLTKPSRTATGIDV